MKVRDVSPRLGSGLPLHRRSQADQPLALCVEVGGVAHHVEMHAAGSSDSALYADAAGSSIIREHQPAVTVFALDFVKAERRSPERCKPIRRRRVERDQIETRRHRSG